MKNENKKCTSKEHESIEAICYCPECKIYMCNKCDIIHSKLCQYHHSYKLDKEINEIYTGLCKNEYHNNNELEFYCKNHNQLCCVACISKIKKKGKGQHADCNICIIEDMKDDIKNKLKENLITLENMSKSIEQSINELKNIFIKINKSKEELKQKIQNIFTKIRNIINDREDGLLIEIDNQFDNIYFKESIIKNSEKLPNKITKSLEIGQKIKDEEWNDENKLHFLINDCISIENSINEINVINENLTKYNNLSEVNIKFYPDENNVLENFFNTIKKFGEIKKEELKELALFKNSDILNIEESNLLYEWLPKKPKNCKLLLNSNKDGDSIKVFTEKCTHKNPTLSIIMTTKGQKFGGYTTKEWKKYGNKDNDAFVFSLNKKMKYKILKPEHATYLENWWGFGPNENAIVIYNNCTKNEGNYVGNGTYDIKEKYELNNGESNFKVKSFEIYQLEF